MPPRSPESLASASDRAACRALIRNGSKSFFAASLFLPQDVREAALALYAFCRTADDAVDCEVAVDPLSRLRERLALAYQRRPLPMPADRAFADVVARYAIPRAIPEALLEGFEWDAAGRRYETISELNAYAARVAGTVGAMMACLMGARTPHAIARACDLGVAMQLTNIARDVGEDARAGRLYLPMQWLREAGVDPGDWPSKAEFSPAIAAVVRRLLRAADSLYERAELGIRCLPRPCRRGIYAARLLYAEIGHELEREGLDSISKRTVVRTNKKLRLLASATLAPPSRRGDSALAALPETQFLVDAVTSERFEPPVSHAGAHARIDQKVAWVVNLFERLEKRQQTTP